MLTAKQDLTKIIFLKIETKPNYFTEQNDEFKSKIKKAFKEKFEHLLKESDIEEDLLLKKATLLPEYGKISAISWGIISDVSGDEYKFSGRTISSDDEIEILVQFAEKMNKLVRKGGDYEYYICGYALKGFDVPFIAKRMILNGISLPPILNTYGLKPWELNSYIDISEAWKMTAWDSYAAMSTLCLLFGIECDFYEKYDESKSLEEIKTNCENKVLAMTNLFLRLKGIKNKVNKI